jgi:hypothetical protein
VANGERMLVGGFMKELLETMWDKPSISGHTCTKEFLHSPAQSLGAVQA